MDCLAQAVCSAYSKAGGPLVELHGFLLQYSGNLEGEWKPAVKSAERNGL